jgi:hypothetical protein
MPFALVANPSPTEVSDAINYLLSNFSNGSTIDPVTGQIIAPGGIVVGYLYKYIAVKYADSADGSVNFSDSPTNRQYFGLRNSDDAAESSNFADYIWYLAAGGFGTTKFLWYQTTGGRQLQVAVSVGAPDVGWFQDTGSSIDLDIITSGTVPVVIESFATYFTPPVLQVPRSGNPLAPVFTFVTPALYATDKGQVIPFSSDQTDTGATFTNNTWRIGNSSTTGYGDISKTNITIGDPTDSGDFALWPVPTAMSNANAFITVPVRYKNSLGVISQASVATQQLVFVDPGANGLPGPTVDISGYTGFTQNSGGLFTPPNAALSAITTNISVPTYSWVISGALPTTASTSSVVVTPTSASTAVTVTLTVGGSNIVGTISKTITMPVVFDGAPGQGGANGFMSAFPSIYIWTGSSVPPTRPSTTSTYTWDTGAYTAPSGWNSQAPSNTTAGNYLWSITVPLNEEATVETSTLDWTNVAYPIRAIAFNGFNGADAIDGVNGTRTAIMDVYQWSVAAPTTFPAGTSTYTWATGQFTAPAALNGWYLTPPPAVLGQTLWIARTLYADNNTTATSSIAWSASVSTPIGAAGTNGTRTAVLEVYQWAATTPTLFPSGTSTYTWATGAFTAPTTANSWSLTPGASTPGYNLYACSVTYSDTNTTATSSVTWSTSTAYIVGSTGTNGSNGAATFVITRVANDSSAPTNAEVNTAIGRDPVSGDICTVSYNSFNNAVVYRYITSWSLFSTYITGSLIVENTITASKLSVTSLNSITANTGTLTVSGTITSNTAAISGSTFSGTGAVIYSSGKFGVGDGTSNLVWDNSSLTIKGDIVSTSSINITGDALFKGQNLSVETILVNGVAYKMDYSAYAEALTLPTVDAMRVGFYGRAAASPNLSIKPTAYNVGVVGYGQNFGGSKGYGVVGTGDEVGGYFEGAGYGAILNGTGTIPIGVAIAGKLMWGIYTYPAPTGSTTTFLRNDGTWAVPAGSSGTGTVTSVATSGTVSGLTLSGGPITTSGTITLGGTLAVAASDITSGVLDAARLGTGTASSTTYLRGDGSWQVAAGTGTVTSIATTGSVSGLTLSGGTITTTGTITLGGTLAVAGSDITSGTIGTARLGSGTASSSTYLRGDGAWSSISATYTANLGVSGTSYSAVLSGGVLSLQSTNNTCSITNSSGNGVFFTSNVGPTFCPTSNNAYSCGYPGLLWSVIYAATGTINTSDRNQKQDEEALSTAELAVAKRIKSLIKKFKFKRAVEEKGSQARIHVGVIAQDVRDAFAAEGLDATHYGIFCSDTSEEGVTTLGVRYEELLAFVIAAM